MPRDFLRFTTRIGIDGIHQAKQGQMRYRTKFNLNFGVSENGDSFEMIKRNRNDCPIFRQIRFREYHDGSQEMGFHLRS